MDEGLSRYNPGLRRDELEELLSGPARAICALVNRQIMAVQDGESSFIPESDTSLDVLEQVVQAFDKGVSVEDLKPAVDQLTMAQEDRVNLVTSLSTSHNLSRMVRLMKSRDRLERFMHSSIDRNDITTTEALAFLKIIQADMAEIQETLTPVPIKDSDGLVTKVDYSTKKTTSANISKFEHTSPHGRDIIRKLLHGILKQTQGVGATVEAVEAKPATPRVGDFDVE